MLLSCASAWLPVCPPVAGDSGLSLPSPAVHVSQVIGFDMGGTSTDVSRYAGTYEHVFETTTAGDALCGVLCEGTTCQAASVGPVTD